MITAGPSLVWDIDLKDLRTRFPNASLIGDEQTELVNFLRKKFEFEIPKDQRKYSRINIHLECETGTDENLDVSLGGEFGETLGLKSYPVVMKPTPEGKVMNCTIGVESGLLSFYPKLTRLHDSTQDSVSFKVRIKYMN
jgi:hypothetical protein